MSSFSAFQQHATLALAGLRANPLRSALTCLAVALAVALFLGALGLHDGYAAALAASVEKMGYQVLVTAKGCPYETATLVLRGGNIPMYVDESLVQTLREDPAWESGVVVKLKVLLSLSTNVSRPQSRRR